MSSLGRKIAGGLLKGIGDAGISTIQKRRVDLLADKVHLRAVAQIDRRHEGDLEIETARQEFATSERQAGQNFEVSKMGLEQLSRLALLDDAQLHEMGLSRERIDAARALQDDQQEATVALQDDAQEFTEAENRAHEAFLEGTASQAQLDALTRLDDAQLAQLELTREQIQAQKELQESAQTFTTSEREAAEGATVGIVLLRGQQEIDAAREGEARAIRLWNIDNEARIKAAKVVNTNAVVAAARREGNYAGSVVSKDGFLIVLHEDGSQTVTDHRVGNDVREALATQAAAWKQALDLHTTSDGVREVIDWAGVADTLVEQEPGLAAKVQQTIDAVEAQDAETRLRAAAKAIVNGMVGRFWDDDFLEAAGTKENAEEQIYQGLLDKEQGTAPAPMFPTPNADALAFLAENPGSKDDFIATYGGLAYDRAIAPSGRDGFEVPTEASIQALLANPDKAALFIRRFGRAAYDRALGPGRAVFDPGAVGG